MGAGTAPVAPDLAGGRGRLLVAGAVGIAFAPAWALLLAGAFGIGVGSGWWWSSSTCWWPRGPASGRRPCSTWSAPASAPARPRPAGHRGQRRLPAAVLRRRPDGRGVLALTRDVARTPRPPAPPEARLAPGLVGGFVALTALYVAVESGIGGWEATSLRAGGAARPRRPADGRLGGHHRGRLAIPLALRLVRARAGRRVPAAGGGGAVPGPRPRRSPPSPTP